MFSIDHTKPAALPSPNPTRSFWVNSSLDANSFAREGTSGLLTTDADMCIIGSGITGVSMAYLKWLYRYFTLSLITLITTFYFFTYITLHLHPCHNSHTQAECIPCLSLYPTPQNILLHSSKFYTSPKLLLRQYISSVLSLVVVENHGIHFSELLFHNHGSRLIIWSSILWFLMTLFILCVLSFILLIFDKSLLCYWIADWYSLQFSHLCLYCLLIHYILFHDNLRYCMD